MPDPTPASLIPATTPSPAVVAPVVPTPLVTQPAPSPAPAAVAPAPPTPAKVDAILCPHMYPTGLTDTDLLLARNAEFGPILGSKIVWSHEVKGQGDIVRPGTKRGHTNPDFYFPHAHPRYAGDHRYAWTDRGDGVQYGTLVQDDTPSAVKAKAAAEFAAKQAAFLATPEGKALKLAQIDQMVKAGILTDADSLAYKAAV